MFAIDVREWQLQNIVGQYREQAEPKIAKAAEPAAWRDEAFRDEAFRDEAFQCCSEISVLKRLIPKRIFQKDRSPD